MEYKLEQKKVRQRIYIQYCIITAWIASVSYTPKKNKIITIILIPN